MKKRMTLPRWGQWAAGLALITIAITAGAVSLTLNISHGLESGLATAIIFGLADATKVALPAVALAIGWTLYMRWTLIACAIVSLTCAASYYADTQGKLFLARERQATVWQGTSADLARTRAELTRIPESANAEDLDKLSALATARADHEEARGGCGTNCEAARREAITFTERASQARRRAELETVLGTAKAEASASGGPTEVSGLATLIALATAGNPNVIARWIGAGKAILSIVLLETLVFLSIPGSQLIGRAMSRQRRRTTKTVAKARSRKSAQGVKLVRQQPAPLVQLRNAADRVSA